MRRILLLCSLSLATLTACGDDFASAQADGSIEAFEKYLADNPKGRFRIQAKAQLETLYLEDARKQGSLEAYDRYLERFPEGDLREKAKAEREQFLFDWAKLESTEAAWEKFLGEYPKADKKRLAEAKRLKAVASYADQLAWTDLVVEPTNLAEDPKGPKDGWGFTMEVTNNGTKTLKDLRFTVEYLGPNPGQVLDSREWPVVAKDWGIPMEEEKKVPMKPGETRTWFWSVGGLPEIWEQKARVFPSRVAFVE
ncbi:MAG: hypothetical protein H6737_10600 [Alphaproteobacteria bacterium]|nr:hypothetical protein [Alphaproteobacteria bacterium]